MTLALSSTAPPHEPSELLLELREQLRHCQGPSAAAGAAAELLHASLPNGSVSVLRYEPRSGSLVLLASVPGGASGAAPGAHLPLRDGPLSDALASGETRRRMNGYVEPDFVRSLPGETRSEVVIPIHREGAVWGVVQLDYAAPHRPSAADEALAEAVAGELGDTTALTAAPGGADPALLRRPEGAERLAAIAHHLAHSTDLPGALQRVSQSALDVVPAASAVLLLRHESRQMLEASAVAGEPLLQVGELIPLDRSIPGRVAADARPRACAVLETDTEVFSPVDRERGISSVLAVPMSAAGKTYGVLAVLNRQSGGFTPQEVEALQQVADQAAAIEAMRSIGPLRQRLSDSSLLAEVGRAVTGTLGLEDVLAVVVRAAEMLVRARSTAVALTSGDGQRLELAATAGALFRHQGTSVPVQASLMGWAALTGDVVAVPSIEGDPRRSEVEAGLGPGVIVPIESRTGVHGVLLAARAPGAESPSEGDEDALRKLSGYAAIAIENARLYQEQTELSARLRAQAEELERAYADLHTSQERLVVSEKMAALGRVTAGIAHEINSPLGGILNCLQMAQTYVDEYRSSIGDPEVSADDHTAIATDLAEALALAEASTRKVAQFVRTIKGQTRTGGQEERTLFHVAEEIEGVITLLQHELKDRHVELRTDLHQGSTLNGDASKFCLILQNLISNAVDAFEGKQGEVDVRWRVEDGRGVLEVEDHGCGIPEGIRGRIYDYMFTTKDIGQGTGLGLSMVHSIVTSHFEGEVDFRSEIGVGTTFTVTFPVPADKV